MRLTKQQFRQIIKEESEAAILETYVSSLEERLGRELTEEEINEIDWKKLGRSAALGGALTLGSLALPGDSPSPAPPETSAVADPGEEGVTDLTGEGSFKNAFATARDMGWDVFKYRGKLFNTELAKTEKEPKDAGPDEREVDLAKTHGTLASAFSTGKVPRHHAPQRGQLHVGRGSLREKLDRNILVQLIKEELEVILTDPEAKEFFGDNVFEGGDGGHYLGSGNPRAGRYDPEDSSNTPEAIAKDEATTAMMNGLKAHLRSRSDLTPEAVEHIFLDVEEALVAGLEGVHIPAPLHMPVDNEELELYEDVK